MFDFGLGNSISTSSHGHEQAVGFGGLTVFLQFLQFKDLKEDGEGAEFDTCQAGKEEGKGLVEESRDGH